MGSVRKWRTSVMCLDGVQRESGVSLPPVVTDAGIGLNDQTRDVHLLESGPDVQTSLATTNCAKLVPQNQ